ncbi:hypothetical protein EIN_340300 [Entamoeba invadens IP1]|uniref:Uncharacterized protein n=1 Tax=Entamoeba invadens IP1 TaxID=370355 RepID=A0A0A1UE00_ENTIV|nr:hypothetical protein EIN_340300 [Entamoeba invadens IP1]ELP94712.1 hypothetical protein EIN_340300 [Entamoeba invadens IP1]|eukprot:XP_004261483.1 hypothetical protein EIN_340300 [Entamoeba invadens IP1]
MDVELDSLITQLTAFKASLSTQWKPSYEYYVDNTTLPRNQRIAAAENYIKSSSYMGLFAAQIQQVKNSLNRFNRLLDASTFNDKDPKYTTVVYLLNKLYDEEYNESVRNLQQMLMSQRINGIQYDQKMKEISAYLSSRKTSLSDLFVTNKPNTMFPINDEEIAVLEEFTTRKISSVLFDSDKEDWSKNSSIFHDKIYRNNMLCFLVEDDRNNKFGGVMYDTVIDGNGWTRSSSAFIFSLIRKGILKPKKFVIRQSRGFDFEDRDIPEEGAFVLHRQQHEFLFGFGGGCDFEVSKKGEKSSRCIPGTYIAQLGDLMDDKYFNTKRVLVFKLN